MTLPISLTTERNYHILRGDVLLKLNDLGDPSCTSVVTSSDASMRINVDLKDVYQQLHNTVVTDGVVSDATPSFFDEDGNYRTWHIKGYPTYFHSADKRYCHIAVKYDKFIDTKNPELCDEAVIVFSSRRLDLFGRPVSDDGKLFINANGNEVTNPHPNYVDFDIFPVDENYFYIYIGRISASEGKMREWEDGPYYGILGTPAYLQSDIDESAAELPHLSAEPEFAQFSWMGTAYTEKEQTIRARIVMPEGLSSAPSLNNVIDEAELSILPLLSSEQTGHISSDVRSIVTDADGKLTIDTAIRFDLCSFVSHRTITEFASITTTIAAQPLLTVEPMPQAGAIFIRLKAGYDLNQPIEADVTATTADGFAFTRHFAVRSIPNDATEPQLTAQYMRLRPSSTFVLRRNADGTLSQSSLFADRIATMPDGSAQPSTVGRVWLSTASTDEDETTAEWTEVEDLANISDIPADATSIRLRWTLTHSSEAYVYDYTSDAPSIGDYFIVGSFTRMPHDGEPSVFSQLTTPSDADAPAPDAEATAPTSVSDGFPIGTTPTAPTDATVDTPIGPSPTDPPIDAPEAQPDFVIGTEFVVTPDHQRLYLALFDRSTRKVIDSLVVPVIKDGRTVGNVAPNRFRNSCFLGQQTTYYDIAGTATFADDENFGSYPVLHLAPTDDSPLATITHQAATPLDGIVWQSGSRYITSVWARGAGQLCMAAQGPLFAEQVSETFELTGEWTRYHITAECKSPASIEGSSITLARLQPSPDTPDAALSLQLACPKLEVADMLTDWCLSENDKRGSSLTVHLSKVLIAVKKTSSVWAEEGIDAEDGMEAAQQEVIEAKVLYGSRDTVAITSIDFQSTPGIDNIDIAMTEDRKQAVISFLITTDFDVTRITDTRLTFHCDGFLEPLEATLSFVPAADGEDGAQGESGMDAIQALIFSESGNLRVPENGVERIYVRVYRGGIDITDSLVHPTFVWRRVSKYPHDDDLWNRVHAVGDTYNKPYLDLSDNDIERRAQFECDVTFEL